MEDIRRRWPLHWLVWNNMHEELKTVLKRNEDDASCSSNPDLEELDPRGRTPLMLAVTLAHAECVEDLVRAGASVSCDREGWTVLQEAVSCGDPRVVSIVLSERDLQRQALRSSGVPLLLRQLSAAPDFYVEMKWEFTSWVPLVSRMCPFDTYKVYKQGSNVRIDTTLLGFEQNKWQRGNRTYIFQGRGDSAQMVELDHDARTVWVECFECSPEDGPARHAAVVSREAIGHRLSAPLCINYLDTEKINFERNKSGVWGWRQDKLETINGYECKVFSANNVELVSKTRTEHLTKGDKARAHTPAGARPPLLHLLAIADSHEQTTSQAPAQEDSLSSLRNPNNLSAEEYFSNEDLDGRDIGRPREITTKIQKFKATLWLCETYPLQLQEQIMPILDLMASMSSPHFSKLKDFIQMQLPSGFPVKIEIPLYHVLNAQITFGNIFAMEEAVSGVRNLSEADRLSCVVDDDCFTVPLGYRHLGSEDDDRRQYSYEEEEDDLLQYAIQQSLIDGNNPDHEQVDIWEALKVERSSRPATPSLLSEEERQLQRAIQASLESAGGATTPSASSDDSELETTLQLSLLEREKQERELQREQYELDRILKLSLLDK